MTRRRIQRDLNELWHYISSRLQEATEELRRKLSEKQLASLLKKTLLNIRHRYNVLKADIDSLAGVDGYDDWRKKESKELTSIVENRLKELQNPLDCQAAKTLVCKLNINCGYGCQSHHAVYCLNLALATTGGHLIEFHLIESLDRKFLII
jgi:glycoprotein 6-alpha-L-fucosyltransferase